MVFSAPGYVGDYSVAVPAGLAVGDTFQFDGDLVKEAPPREKKSALDGPRQQPGAFVRAPVAVPAAMGSVGVRGRGPLDRPRGRLPVRAEAKAQAKLHAASAEKVLTPPTVV